MFHTVTSINPWLFFFQKPFIKNLVISFHCVNDEQHDFSIQGEKKALTYRMVPIKQYSTASLHLLGGRYRTLLPFDSHCNCRFYWSPILINCFFLEFACPFQLGGANNFFNLTQLLCRSGLTSTFGHNQRNILFLKSKKYIFLKISSDFSLYMLLGVQTNIFILKWSNTSIVPSTPT